VTAEWLEVNDEVNAVADMAPSVSAKSVAPHWLDTSLPRVVCMEK
jgi:hypothetical protein